LTSTIGQRQWHQSNTIHSTIFCASIDHILRRVRSAQITGTALCGIARTFERFGKRAVFYGQYRNKVTSLAYLDCTGRLDEASTKAATLVIQCAPAKSTPPGEIFFSSTLVKNIGDRSAFP
jgi:hypothetical protein